MISSNILNLMIDLPKLLVKQAIQPLRLILRRPLPHPETQIEMANLVNGSLKHKIRAGYKHRFITILFVTVGDRVFCRRYSYGEPSWHSAFQSDSAGQITLDKTIVNIKGQIPNDLDEIIPAVDQAYAAKLKQLGANFMLAGVIEPRAQQSTMELMLADRQANKK